MEDWRTRLDYYVKWSKLLKEAVKYIITWLKWVYKFSEGLTGKEDWIGGTWCSCVTQHQTWHDPAGWHTRDHQLTPTRPAGSKPQLFPIILFPGWPRHIMLAALGHFCEFHGPALVMVTQGASPHIKGCDDWQTQSSLWASLTSRFRK